MRKHNIIHTVLWLTALLATGLNAPTWADELLAWGSDSADQVTALPEGSDYVSIAAGDAHGLALTADGTVLAWGHNGHGQCDVPDETFTAIGAGALFSLAIRPDGTIAAWGDDRSGQVSNVPDDDGFVAVDGGLYFAVALKDDGTIVAWGDDRNNQVSDVPKGGNFVAISAGDAHVVALRSDGSLAAWGYEAAIADTPTTGTYTAVGAGGDFCLALTDRGQIVWWGDDPYDLGLANVPSGSDFVDVAAGFLHALAIKTDGSVVGWGAGVQTSVAPDLGQADPPVRTDYVALAGGLYFSLALTDLVEPQTVSDDFDDNGPGIMWSVLADDPGNCYLDETNQRLELRATAKSDSDSAFYVSKGWAIDPAVDFSFQVDYRQDLGLRSGVSLSILLTPDDEYTASQRIEFGTGSGSLYPHYQVSALNDSGSYYKKNYRSQSSGTLYVSYDASNDNLYLSYRGYGAGNAWATVKGYLQDGWDGRRVNIGLGGSSAQVRIDSGEAYFDNFAIETGAPTVTGFSDVYRFWSPVTGTHFFTINEREKDRLVANYPDVWTFEGVVFKAATTALDPGLSHVYRFWSDKIAAHFYTINESEAEKLVDEYADIWTFEGTAFYAYPDGQQPAGAAPVYRLRNAQTGAHFYTVSEKEKDKLIQDYPKTYVFEGVAFYAFD